MGITLMGGAISSESNILFCFMGQMTLIRKRKVFSVLHASERQNFGYGIGKRPSMDSAQATTKKDFSLGSK